MRILKHGFTIDVKRRFITFGRRLSDDKAMLDNQEMARRVSLALDKAPRGVQASIARECDITAQAVTGWRSSGKVDKAHIPTLARLTGRSVAYFLDQSVSDRDSVESTDDYRDWSMVQGFKQAAGLGLGQRADEWAEAHGLMFRKSFYSKIGAAPGDCKVFYGKGDSMQPTIQDGDAFLFVTSDTSPRKGNLYLLHIDNATDSKEYNVKRCVGGGMFAADNPGGDHDWKEPRTLGPGDEVLGRVRWIGRMVK